MNIRMAYHATAICLMLLGGTSAILVQVVKALAK